MTTYTNIANGAIDQDSPVTQTLMQALRDNPIAIAEQSSGAPKIASKNLFGGGTGVNIDFIVTDFAGARFFINFYNSGVGSTSISLNVSDGTFDTAVTLVATVPASAGGSLSGYWDEASGSIACAYQVGSFMGTGSGTFSKTSGITTLRIVGTSNMGISAHVMPDGGETP